LVPSHSSWSTFRLHLMRGPKPLLTIFLRNQTIDVGPKKRPSSMVRFHGPWCKHALIEQNNVVGKCNHWWPHLPYIPTSHLVLLFCTHLKFELAGYATSGVLIRSFWKSDLPPLSLHVFVHRLCNWVVIIYGPLCGTLLIWTTYVWVCPKVCEVNHYKKNMVFLIVGSLQGWIKPKFLWPMY